MEKVLTKKKSPRKGLKKWQFIMLIAMIVCFSISALAMILVIAKAPLAFWGKVSGVAAVLGILALLIMNALYRLEQKSPIIRGAAIAAILLHLIWGVMEIVSILGLFGWIYPDSCIAAHNYTNEAYQVCLVDYDLFRQIYQEILLTALTMAGTITAIINYASVKNHNLVIKIAKIITIALAIVTEITYIIDIFTLPKPSELLIRFTLISTVLLGLSMIITPILAKIYRKKIS